MPRDIGASVGVKDTVTGASAAQPRACSISGCADGRRPPCRPTWSRTPRWRAERPWPCGLPRRSPTRPPPPRPRLHQIGSEQRAQRQDRRRRVAAWIRHPRGLGDPPASAGELGQAVGPGTGPVARVVVSPRLGLGQAVVRAQIHHRQVRRQRPGDRRRGTVRQGQEHQVGVGGEGVGIQGRERARGELREVRMNAADTCPGVGPAATAPTSIPDGPAAGAAARRRHSRSRPRPLQPPCHDNIRIFA